MEFGGSTIMNDKLWVGSLKTSTMCWLYDPSIQHTDPSKIYLFNSATYCMEEYSKIEMKSALISVNDSNRSICIKDYEKWASTQTGRKFIEDESGTIEEKLLRKHKTFIEMLGKEYKGVKPTKKQTQRTTHCYRCKSKLESVINYDCTECGWLICSCGACGCGFNLY